MTDPDHRDSGGLGMPLFKECAYCGLTRLCHDYGRRWLCDDCAMEHGLHPGGES